MEKGNLTPQNNLESESSDSAMKLSLDEKRLMDVSDRLMKIDAELKSNPGARRAAELRETRTRLNQEQKKFLKNIGKEEDVQPEKISTIEKENFETKNNLISKTKSSINDFFAKKEVPINTLQKKEKIVKKVKEEPTLLQKTKLGTKKIMAFFGLLRNKEIKKNVPQEETDMSGMDEYTKEEKDFSTPDDSNKIEKEISLEEFMNQVHLLLSNAIEKHFSNDPILKEYASKILPSMVEDFKMGYEKTKTPKEKIELLKFLNSFCNDEPSFIAQIEQFKFKEDESIDIDNSKKESETKKTIPNFLNTKLNNINQNTELNNIPQEEGTVTNNNLEPVTPTLKSTKGFLNTSIENMYKNTPEDLDKTDTIIAPDNKGFFKRMSEKGKGIMSSMYKGIENTISESTLVAKVNIAYNQVWIDNKEDQSISLKGKVDELGLELKTFNQSKTKMVEVAENLKNANNPAYASMLAEIKKIEKQEIKISNKQDKLQSKLENRENQIKLYTNKRDQIADKMVMKYERKLSPIEQKLGLLDEQRDRTNLYVLGREAELEEEKANLDYLQEQKMLIISALIGGEDPSKDQSKAIDKASKNKAVKLLEKQIETGNIKIDSAKLELKDKQNKINEEINTTNFMAQPHRDSRDQFIRVKMGRPINLDLQKRVVLENKNTFEQTTPYTRTSPDTSVNTPPSPTSTGGSSWFERTPKIGELITNYNEYLEKKNPGNNLKIDSITLLNGLWKASGDRVSLLKFKEMAKLYYKMKKVPENDYIKLLNEHKLN